MAQLQHPILDIPPSEDAGALTLARYGYQHNCAVPYVLQTLADSSPVLAVVCETHEDFLIFHDWGPELVSVKHRELTQGPWTLSQLCAGALSHLLDRWLLTGRQARCRLLTNHSLKPGGEDALSLAEGCASSDKESLEIWAAKLAQPLQTDAEILVEFLGALALEHGLPGRPHIADIYRTHQLRPLLRRLKIPGELDEVIYGRVLGEVARASSDDCAAGDALMEALLTKDGHSRLSVLQRRIRRRTLDKTRVAACLTDLPSRRLKLGTAEKAPPPTRLVQKLSAGGVGETAIRSAQRLRADWYDLEARWRGLPGTRSEFADLRTRAQALAARVESEVATSAPYGRAMHVALTDRLVDGAITAAAPFELDADLLMGLLFELTDECEVWWSEPFPLP